MTSKKEIYFGKCTLNFLEKRFGLRPKSKLQVLDDWLNMDIIVTEKEQEILTLYRDLLVENILHWQEQELALQFIGPLIGMAHFTDVKRRINFFSLRPVVVFLEDDTKFHGKPDGMVASGYREPEIPYFAFQEYKKDVDSLGDPAGQALAAMLAGQLLNDKDQVIYGCYINGRAWNFMVLKGKEYAISQDYSAMTDDLVDIFRLLKALKVLVLKMTE